MSILALYVPNFSLRPQVLHMYKQVPGTSPIQLGSLYRASCTLHVRHVILDGGPIRNADLALSRSVYARTRLGSQGHQIFPCRQGCPVKHGVTISTNLRSMSAKLSASSLTVLPSIPCSSSPTVCHTRCSHLPASDVIARLSLNCFEDTG